MTATQQHAPRLPIWKRILFSVVVLCTLATVVEGLTRWGNLDQRFFSEAFEDPYEKSKMGWWRLITYDPVLDWKGRPFARLPGTGEFLNARGFRGSNFSDAKPSNLRRIVCMGDSATFGLVTHGGIDFRYTPTYSSELQRLLNTDPNVQHVEVINAGVIGYATPQGLRLLKHGVRHWQPDLITIRYGVNDHLRESWGSTAPSEPRNALLRWSETMLLDLRTVQLLLRMKPGNRAPTRAPREQSTRPVEKTVPLRVSLQDFEYNLRRMVTVGRAAGAKVVLMTAPLAPLAPEITSDAVTLRVLGFPTYEDLVTEHRRYEDAVRKVATEMEAELVDSSRDLAARGLERYFTRYDLAHPSGPGHAAIGADLASLIVAKRLVEIPEPSEEATPIARPPARAAQQSGAIATGDR